MRSRKKITEHVSYTEATKSKTAIANGLDNHPNDLQLKRMRAVASNVFEKVRSRFCVPIHVSSFFRSAEVNKLVGGSDTSQHVSGEAMDLDADVYGMVTNREIFDFIRTHLDFDQLIWEYGDNEEPDWVHVSYKEHGGNRKQILRATRYKNWRGKIKTKYSVIK